MKKLILTLVVLALALPCYAGDVTQLVFSITSSAKTSTPNLRITKMTKVMRKDNNIIPLQGFALEPDATYNYYLTKNITFPVTADMIALEIERDQDTKLYVNSETAYKILPAGETRPYVLK